MNRIGPQVAAIAWAQFRTMRNHLPRTNVGTVLMWLVSLVWYGMFAAFGLFLALEVPSVPLPIIREWLPAGLLGVFLFWQLIPLFTLSSGWSLQLNKLQIYPVSNNALFAIEVLLRLTTAPEMILVLFGAFIGLARHAEVSLLSPFLLLLYIPFNLFLSLGIRDLLLHSFARNRFRELFAILLFSIGILPQILLRTGLGDRMKPYAIAVSRGWATPWHEIATLSLGSRSVLSFALVLLWIALAYGFAKWQFARTLVSEERFRPDASPRDASAPAESKGRARRGFLDALSGMFSDPMAALLQKEFQSLVRMPRFRVILGMACIFGVVIFIPMTMGRSGRAMPGFIANNFLPVACLYGLLLLSDVLLVNIFGFDRGAAQIYFVTPVPFQAVIRAKNLTAVAFIAFQNIVVLIIVSLVHMSISPLNVAAALAASAVVSIFFISIGNLSSIAMPRPMDPTQTMRKQAGGKMQLWLMLCTLGMFVLVGFAFLARWALQSNWAFLAVLLVEFGIGAIVYKLATESAVARGLRDRERIIEALSKGAAPVGLGL